MPLPFTRKRREADVVLKPGKYKVVRSRDSIEDETQDVLGWYERWRKRIHAWVSRHADETLASILLLVPDLLVLVIRLTKDQRVPWVVKGQLALAAAYVLSPLDLVPEAFLGPIGLAEDAGVLALVLYWLKSVGSLDPTVLRENYPGKGDVEKVIDNLHERITENREKIASDEVWRIIERRFRKPVEKPQPARRGWVRRLVRAR